MNKIPIALALALMIISGLVGYMFGYSQTGEYRTTMFNKAPMNLGNPGKLFDLNYLNAMISHHTSAVLLAEQAQTQTTRMEIRELANKILADEPVAIKELYDYKQTWYKDNRQVKKPQVANLGTADEKFDLRFLNALIAHHEEGLQMTKETMQKTTRTETLNNANAVDIFLKTTLKILQNWRTEWYGL
jgi:uncharacterized protein (DUF305 family)